MKTHYIVTSADEVECQTFFDSIYAETNEEAIKIVTACRPYATVCEVDTADDFLELAMNLAQTTEHESGAHVANLLAHEAEITGATTP